MVTDTMTAANMKTRDIINQGLFTVFENLLFCVDCLAWTGDGILSPGLVVPTTPTSDCPVSDELMDLRFSVTSGIVIADFTLGKDLIVWLCCTDEGEGVLMKDVEGTFVVGTAGHPEGLGLQRWKAEQLGWI